MCPVSVSYCCPNLRSFLGKDHRIDNNVKVSLTFAAPIMRQMETSSSIPPSTADTAPTPINTETETRRNFRLAFGVMWENPNLKLRNSV